MIDYQEAINLNEEQKKAWKQLVRAINKCKKEHIFFYQCLEDLGGLNGNNVSTIGIDSGDYGDDNCLQGLSYPRVETSCSFADDNHFVILKD